ncbi:aspartyl protease family protein At5g10770-like isoform X1 [Prunus avium]|uniref:Aspartyl protease family protein At5g10770-like isoform X1 n=1 Tax=Prunus avium TaxID=42229 RepID=A0A6P5RRP0_PRUAV|nr:aspartyl protease family protein At5g10770-like isoform X1 [Prunus avium]
MATPIISSSSFLRFFMGFFSVFLCLILCSFDNGFALAARDTKPHPLPHTTHTVEVKSLLPPTTCSPSTKGHKNNKASSVLKVVHKHGPCSKFHKSSKTSTTTCDEKYHTQILKQDQARVNSIHSRLNHNNNRDPLTQSAATTLPAKSGDIISSGNYIVTVSLGTPAKQLSLIFDTGSDLTWTQCRPCVRSCYTQSEPIFDPSLSTSYKTISCTTAACTQLLSLGVEQSCFDSTCLYAAEYGDMSFSIGVFGSEKLTLTPTDVFEGFLFGCGLDNEGLFNGSAGLLGLGRSNISIVEQTANKYNRFFSYCLPSTSCSPGYLRFGKGGRSSNAVKFTTLSTVSQGNPYYGLNVTGINVGGTKLPILASVFSRGTIIDSGTVITRLPPAAYSALRAAFLQAMMSYPLTESAFDILDTCYNFSSFKTVSYPSISFVFGDGLTQDLDATGIFYAVSVDMVCLAFAENEDDSQSGIIGNVQQKRLEVVYDVAGGRVGFAPAGCP